MVVAPLPKFQLQLVIFPGVTVDWSSKEVVLNRQVSLAANAAFGVGFTTTVPVPVVLQATELSTVSDTMYVPGAE